VIRRLVRHIAFSRGKAISLYRQLCSPSGQEWAELLRRRGGFHRIGDECTIFPTAIFTDPSMTAIGDRVGIGGACTVICHDGSIGMIERRYGVKLDRIGAVVIEDDVFLGEQAMILATSGTTLTIGAGSIIGAGSVVRTSVPPGSVVIGNPAKVMASVEDMLRFWEADFERMPWKDLILARQGAYDPAFEPELLRIRQAHFFGEAPAP